MKHIICIIELAKSDISSSTIIDRDKPRLSRFYRKMSVSRRFVLLLLIQTKLKHRLYFRTLFTTTFHFHSSYQSETNPMTTIPFIQLTTEFYLLTLIDMLEIPTFYKYFYYSITLTNLNKTSYACNMTVAGFDHNLY